MPPQNFTNKSQEAIQTAARFASETGQGHVEPPHLFAAFLNDPESVVTSILQKLNAPAKDIECGVTQQISRLPKEGAALHERAVGQIMLGPATAAIFDMAAAEAKKMGDDYISVEHLFLAFLVNRNPIAELL